MRERGNRTFIFSFGAIAVVVVVGVVVGMGFVVVVVVVDVVVVVVILGGLVTSGITFLVLSFGRGKNKKVIHFEKGNIIQKSRF